jgi:protein arginine kinase activator
MLCEKCHKLEAIIPVIKIVDGEFTVMHLCEKCAGEITGKIKKDMESFFPSFPDLFSKLFSDFPSFHTEFFAPLKEENIKPPKIEELKCPRCGLTYEDFRKTFQLGCTQCYQRFQKQLEPMLRRIHGSTIHKGKNSRQVPARVKLSKDRIKELRIKLAAVVKREEYEEAARLRDAIKALEKRKKK